MRWTVRAILIAALAAFCPGASYAADSLAPLNPGLGSKTIENPVADLFKILGEALFSVSEQTRSKLLDFLETVELWDPEREIDRLVGDPWRLDDSTSYKLRLMPVYLAYPFYEQITRQTTRLDDRRALRIQDVSPDTVQTMALRFDAVSDVKRPEDLANSALGTFSGRELADLSVFALAQQPYFPETDTDWDATKHRLASNKTIFISTALAAGFGFDAAAFSRTGGIYKSPRGGFDLRWYGGFRRLGFRMRPQLRAGLLASFARMQVSGGWWEQIRPESSGRQRAIELALREGWLDRLTRTSGWDTFFETAYRRVVSAEPGYAGESSTGHAGMFFRRRSPFRMRQVVFRGSTELESDFSGSTRFVAGIGVEHARTGLATVLQSSRTVLRQVGQRAHDTSVGLFVAGTVETPTQFLEDAMFGSARQVMDEWAFVNSPSTDLSSANAEIPELAGALADYLENRHQVYAVMHRGRSPDDLDGPLDADLLLAVRDRILTRIQDLLTFLRKSEQRLSALDALATQVRQSAEYEDSQSALKHAYNVESESLGSIRRLEAERMGTALADYDQLTGIVRRISAASPVMGSPMRHLELLRSGERRRLVIWATPPVRQ